MYRLKIDGVGVQIENNEKHNNTKPEQYETNFFTRKS